MSASKHSSPGPLVLVDGSSYLYRAFHALPSLTTSGGAHTGAVKGVISMFRRLLKDYPGSTVVAVFDASGRTFRDDLYDQYKSHRPPMPDELRTQIQPIHDIIRALGLPLLCVPGVEADDVIGTLARRAASRGRDVVVSTGDKDMAQLVCDRVTLVNTMTDTTLDPAGVEERFGLPPNRIVDYLALMGDKVDNIPGVAGVGEKTAVALIRGLGGLDDIYRSLDRVPGLPIRGAARLADKLRASEEDARLSRRLATIRTDVELDVDPETLTLGAADRAVLRSAYEACEFRSWLAELEESDAGSGTADADAGTASSTDYAVILDADALAVWVRRLREAPLFAVDTETTSLDYMVAELVGVSVAVGPGDAAYIPFGHDYEGAPQQLGRDEVLEQLRPLLEDPERPKVGQNLKYDISVLARHGVTLRGVRFDTMLESYVLDSTATRHDMDGLALRHLGRQTTRFEDIAGKGARQLTFNRVELAKAAPYAAEDADVTLALHRQLWPRVEADRLLHELFENIELPLVQVLSAMERTGVRIDSVLLGRQSEELATRLAELEMQAHELAGETFNLASPRQLGEILFERLGLPVLRKTPKGAPSTAEEVLAELALDYPLPQVILDHRGLSKLKSTYADKLPLLVNSESERIHTSYHQAGTATGRLSSSDPNLQNIPIRTAEGRRIRQAFVAEPGHRLIAADYSQIELRIMAHLSGDEGLLRAFAEGLDVHRATAAEVFDCALDAVTDEQRRKAKAINFGLIYGMSAFGLARQLRLSRYEAQHYIDRYFTRYPGVRAYMDRTRELARERGYVETLFHRRLKLPEINARNRARQQAAERTAINAPMQGTAADIIKRAMISVDRWLREDRVDARMIMQVHDELVLEVAEGAVEQVRAGLPARMEGAAELAVPLLVECGEGANWDEAH